MKKISLILLIFLLPLCLVPPTAAVYGDESPQSILSFSETLPDDVLFYPDSWQNNTPIVASSGSGTGSPTGDYTDTHSVNSVYYTSGVGEYLYLNYTMTTSISNLESFNYAFYTKHEGVGSKNVTLVAYDWIDNDWYGAEVVTPMETGVLGWVNGTYYLSRYWSDTQIAIRVYTDESDIYVDYGQVSISYMTLKSSSHFGDSFADVSDWTKQEGPAEMTSDGDQGQFDLPDDNAYDRFYSDVPSIAQGISSYWEIRASTNDSTALSCYLLVYGYSTDGYGSGSSIPYVILDYIDDDGTTLKGFYDGTYALESIVVIAKALIAGHAIEVSIDYLRVSPANESGGWQHDGSTTEGISTGAGGSISTDGDVVNCSSSAAGREFRFDFDTTATVALSEGDYYQFLEISIGQVSDGDGDSLVWRPRITDGSTYEYLAEKQGSAGIFRYNVKASTVPDIKHVYLYIDDDLDWFTVDWVKLYSIANYTVNQHANTLINYVLYVNDDNALVRSGEESANIWTSIKPDFSMSVTMADYLTVNITYSNVDSDLQWAYRESATSGSWYYEPNYRFIPDRVTTTSFLLNIYHECVISAIKYIDTRDWQEIGEVEFVIPVGWDPTFQFGYDSFFIFLGLIMIPVSTMYLVRGGREEMSADKLFYGLIIFAVGFGLLVGGIMP